MLLYQFLVHLFQNAKDIILESLMPTFQTIWFLNCFKNFIHLSPLNGGWHPKRHPLLDPWLETGAWASPPSTLRPTTTRPPPQGSATPATRPAAAHTRREVESFGRRVKEPRRPAGGGVRYRWRWEEHGGGVAGGSRCLAESKPGLSWHWAGPEAGRGSH